jgi:hypothetical protein
MQMIIINHNLNSLQSQMLYTHSDIDNSPTADATDDDDVNPI